MKLPKKISFSKAQKMADNALSALVRAEAGNRCEIHEAIRKQNIFGFPVKCSEPMCAYHIIPKGQSHSLRYDRKNVVCACSGLNQWERNNRNEMEKWHKLIFSDRWEYLMRFRKVIVKRNASMLVLMAEEFKRKLNALNHD